MLDEHFSEDEAERQLDTALNWGRYAEIFDYDSRPPASSSATRPKPLPVEGEVMANEYRLRPYLRTGPRSCYRAQTWSLLIDFCVFAAAWHSSTPSSSSPAIGSAPSIRTRDFALLRRRCPSMPFYSLVRIARRLCLSAWLSPSSTATSPPTTRAPKRL